MGADVELGEAVGGYVLEAAVGAGATSRVFRARDPETGALAAVKVMGLDVMQSPEVRARLIQEARAVTSVEHPNIVRVLDFIESAGSPQVALVMEWVPGPSLEALRGYPMPPREARRLSLQLARAVEAAHAAGIVHRDLTAGNLLFTSEPGEMAKAEVKLIDFGIAKRLGPEEQIRTAAGTLLGTPAYLAPEQIMGRPPPSPATDVYAVAELVYELFSGERAFQVESSQDVLQKKSRGFVPELALPEPLDLELRPMLRACLSPSPDHRPSLDRLIQTLERIGEASLSIPAGTTALEPPPRERRSPEAAAPELSPEPREEVPSVELREATTSDGLREETAAEDSSEPREEGLDTQRIAPEETMAALVRAAELRRSEEAKRTSPSVRPGVDEASTELLDMDSVLPPMPSSPTNGSLDRLVARSSPPPPSITAPSETNSEPPVHLEAEPSLPALSLHAQPRPSSRPSKGPLPVPELAHAESSAGGAPASRPPEASSSSAELPAVEAAATDPSPVWGWVVVGGVVASAVLGWWLLG